MVRRTYQSALFFIMVSLLVILQGVSNGQTVEGTRTAKATAKATAYDQDVTLIEDSKIEIRLEATGPDDIALTYSISRRPLHGKLSKLRGNTVTYTPYRNYCGSDKFMFRVYSREPKVNSNNATVSITVTALPDKPFAQEVMAITTQNTPIEIDLVGFDPDGDELKYDITGRPENGKIKLIDETHNIYLYTPEVDFVGNDRFTFEANDGQSTSEPATVNITIDPSYEIWLPTNDESVYAVRVLEPLRVEKPVDLVADPNDNLYILSTPAFGGSKVLVCNGDLQIQRSFTVDASNPRGITISKNKLYVADTGGNRVLRYLINGELDTSFGSNGSIGRHGSNEGEFDEPWAVGVDSKENIYISDSGNNRVQIFDVSGRFKSQWQQKTEYDIKSGRRNPIIRDERIERMRDEMLSSPREIVWFDQVCVEDRIPIRKPRGFCILPSGDDEISLADTENHKIKRLSCRGGYLFSACGKKGSALGCFNYPSDVDYDLEMGQLIVADTGNNRIQVLQLCRSSEFLRTRAMTCIQEISDQNLSGPMGVAVVTKQPNQFIYVADTGNNRVLKLQNGLNKPGSSPADVWE